MKYIPAEIQYPESGICHPHFARCIEFTANGIRFMCKIYKRIETVTAADMAFEYVNR